jgi:hypothetical protein
MQKVKIYLQICGDYVSFGETTATVLYDITNNVLVDTMSYESFEKVKEAYDEAQQNLNDYCDIDIVDAIRTENGEYFYKW